MTQKIATSGAALSGAASTATTRLPRVLLACGVVVGPLFTVVVVIQMLARDGFGPTSHPLSLLSLGGLGWIQITDFVAAGMLIVAAPRIAVAAFRVGDFRLLSAGGALLWGWALVLAAHLLTGLPDVTGSSKAEIKPRLST